MDGNIRVSIFGASHAPEVGVTVEGLPAGERVDIDRLREFLARRAPGRSELATARREPDEPEFRSGLSDGVTDGTPLTAVIRNLDARPDGYAEYRHVPRPGHADYTARAKYGEAWDNAGGGQFSGRMTAPLCIAGGICLQLLEKDGITVNARAVELGGETDEAKMEDAIRAAKAEGDSVGGVAECVIAGLPAGVGGPLFEGLESRIAELVFGIPAVKGVEFGAGFASARLRGSENNDVFAVKNGAVVTETNRCGGLLGGVSTGMPIVFRAAFKPTPSIAREQRSVDLKTMTPVTISVGGRHDPCVVPRALPAVEAAAAIAVLDAWLERKRETSGANELERRRAEIDRIDGELIRLFGRRMDACAHIAAYKKQNGVPVLDRLREAEKLAAVEKSLPDALKPYAKRLYERIFELSRAYQEGEP